MYRLILASLAIGSSAYAQSAPRGAESGGTVSREAAIAAALARGPRLAVARADSAAAGATVVMARQYDNPVLSMQHTGSTPTEHLSLDVPLDLPWIRSARTAVASAALGAVTDRLAIERQSVAYDVDTMYTRALLALARRDLSSRSARDADSLVTLARLRFSAGDASEFDVQLATVAAGQLWATASADSLEVTGLLLGVQSLMGLPASVVTVALSDTLDMGDVAVTSAVGTPLLVRAAERERDAAQRAVAFERRRVLSGTSLSVGFETRDPGGTGNTALPLVGLAVPLPLFNRNGGGIAFAEAQRVRADASLRLAQVELAAATTRAQRSLDVVRARAVRNAGLLTSAERIATLALLAYQEGAATLPGVLEAQRTSREARAQYLDDVAATRIAAGLLRLLTLSGNETIR